MAWYPTRQSLQRTAAAVGALALVLATAPVVPTFDADGDLTFSSGTAHAQGKGGGRGGRGGRGGHGRGQDGNADFGEGHDDGHAVGRGRGQVGHADFGEDHDDGHGVGFGHTSGRPGVGFGHTSARPGLGLGHTELTGNDHHGDLGHDGHDGSHDGSHDGGHGDSSDHHNSDLSFSGAMDNAGRDFGHVKSSAKEAWNDFWN